MTRNEIRDKERRKRESRITTYQGYMKSKQLPLRRSPHRANRRQMTILPRRKPINTNDTVNPGCPGTLRSRRKEFIGYPFNNSS
ncbi:hypothetical protein LSH36_359g00059 [Paralvinella palmiformis]|uniref:Uncharacterized protein n=1 Tax=Paralvinella palmiformis TaxID=53620 RepID=A0AAD9MZH5_9ANNE|nr:hypothetical protein LSH36_359g00059 [Paralvinella palmiformis]